jgi:hypothetical protein
MGRGSRLDEPSPKLGPVWISAVLSSHPATTGSWVSLLEAKVKSGYLWFQKAFPA